MIYWDEILCFPLACDLQISLKCKAFVTGRCWVCTEWPRWCVMSHISYEINWPCVESIVSCSFVLLTQINLQWSCVWLSVITVQQNEAATSILTTDAKHGDLCSLEYYGHSLHWQLQKDSVLLVSQQMKRQWYICQKSPVKPSQILPTTAHEIIHYHLPSISTFLLFWWNFNKIIRKLLDTLLMFL
jgi:hypothetical protein